MGKRYAPPKTSKEDYFDLGLFQAKGMPMWQSTPEEEYDPKLSNEINERRFKTVQDRIGRATEGYLSPIEEQEGYDYYQKPVTDEDGVVRTYNFARDKGGKERKLGVVDGMDAVKLEDIISSSKTNPYYEHEIRKKLFGKMIEDINPLTGEFNSGTSKGFFENALMNSMTAQLGILGAKVFGDKNIGRYGTMDAVMNKLEFEDDGSVTYAGTKLDLGDALSPLTDWFQRKTSYKSSGFLDSFVNTGLTFLIDAPLFYVGGAGASAMLGKFAPVLANATSLPAKYGQHLAQNFLMLNMMGAAGTVNHTIDGGVDALLEDIKHTAEFSLMAGTFSTLGEIGSLGVSKLMQKATPLSTANVSSFLKKNPRIQQNVFGGFASGMLGYATGGDNMQDRLATGMAFASMHFANPQGWKNYVKGEKKSVMVEKDNFREVEALVKSGVPLEQALKELGLREPKYYLREDNQLHEIQSDIFSNKGEIQKVGSEPILMSKENAGNYNYITESMPFAKKTLRQALRDDQILKIQKQILETGFKDIKNPYNKSTQDEQYQNFEYNKLLTSTQLATILHGEKLYKQIKQNGLPEDINLSNIITKSAEALNMPRHIYEKFIVDNFPEYAKDPKVWKELKWLPEEYRKSFESALTATEQAFKRQANQRMIEGLNNRELRLIEVGLGGFETGRVSEFQYQKALDMLGEARNISSIYDAIERAGYSEKVFDDLRSRAKGKETTKQDVNELTQKVGEEKLNKDLDLEAGYTMIEKEFGSRKLAETLTPEEVSTIGKTGAIEPKTREALQQLSEEAWKIGMPEELRPTTENPIVEIPKKVVEEKELGYSVDEPQKAYVDKGKGEKELVDVIKIQNDGKNITYRDSNGKYFNTFKEKVELLNEPVVNHQRYVTELKDILKSNLAREERDRVNMAFNERNPDGSFKAETFYTRLAEKLWGTKDLEVYRKNHEETGYDSVTEGEKRSIAETVKAIRETVKEVFGEEQLKMWDAYDHIWKIAEKMPEVGFYSFFGRKVNDSSTVRERSSTGAHYEVISDAIGLNMQHAQNSFYELRESLGHEIIHALLYGSYKDSKGNVHRYSSALEPELKAIWNKAKEVWVNDRVGKVGSTLKHWGDYVFDMGAERTVNPTQEMVTVGFTSPDFARWLHGIAVDGPRQEIKGSALQAMRDKIMEWFGLTRLHRKDIVDEITEVLNNKFAEWGVFDQNTGQFKDNVRVGNDDRFPTGISVSKQTDKIGVNTEVGIPSKLPPNESLGGSVKPKSEVDTNILPKEKSAVKNELERNIDREIKDNEIVRKPITLDLEAEKPLPKSEPEAKTRKVEKQEVITKRADLIRERELQEKESLRTGRMQNKDRKEPIVSFGEKAQDFMIRHTKLNDVSNKVRDYLYQSIVPVFRKETSPRFREDAYKYGEELIRQAPYEFNTIMKRYDGWAGGQAWRKFADINPINGEVRSQDGKDFLNAFKDYEYGRYQNKITKDLTWDEFKDWANMNDSQRKMLDIYRASVKAGIDKMKEMKVRYMVELDPNLASHVTKSPKTLKEYGFEGLEKEAIEQRIADNVELKRKIAQKVVDDHYANWDKHVYYNSIRPVTKDSILVEVTKNSMNRKDKEGNFINDREYTYFDNMKDAENWLNQKIADGWTKQEMIRLKDILTKQDHWGKLNVSQLMQLANDGHIPLTNDIIQKLMDVTKKGVDLHDISKEYVPGMKYTGQEFELQFERFLREAIYGSHKSYSLTKINDNLNKWRADIDSIIGGISKTSTKGIDAQTIQRMEEEYKYAYGYYNQLRAPEKSIIDPIRGLTFSYYIGGIKPGFLFQQSLQTLQTSLHQGFRELSEAKLGGFGDATRMLGEASSEAIKAGLALRALKEGKDISKIGVDAEYIKLLNDLELMGKMRNVGIAEMTGMSGESDYFYSHNVNKLQEGFVRISNALGGGIEKFTRVQTAGLFYKIGKQKGLSGEALLNYVAEGIDKSMSEFGKGGRAPVFDSKGSVPNQGTIANAMKKSFLTLKTFSFYNTSMYYDMIKGRQWGALGTKMMVGTGMHGITKFPLIASLFMLAELFTDEDMDYTVLRAAYEMDDKLPIPLGKFLRGGFGGFAGIDTRDMLSETTPLITDIVANSWAPTWESKLLEVTLGAPLGFTKDAVDAAQGIKDIIGSKITGNTMYTKAERDRQWKNYDKIAPLWIRNVLASMDYAEDGVMLRGKEIISRDDLTGWDIFLKAMSFPVNRINTAYIEGKDGFEAQIGHHKSVISTAKKFMLEVRDNPKLSGEAKREEIKKAEESMKESKKAIINLEKQIRERDRK